MAGSVWTVVFKGEPSSAVRSSKEVRGELERVQHQTARTGTGFRHAERDLGRLSRGAISGSGIFRSLGRSVAFASGSFLGAVGFVAVVRSSIQRASDLHEELNKVDVVFKASARSVRAWSRNSATGFGLARSEALKFAGTFGNLLTPMGIAPGLAAKMSTRLVELSGDMASFNNASPEEVLQALNSGLTGMVRPLRRFGVFLDQNRISLEAVRSGIVKANVDMGKAADAETKIAVARARLAEAQHKYGAGTTQVASAEVALHSAERALQKELAGRVPQLTAAQKAQASYNLILRDTSNAQGDFKRTSGGLANQQRILRAQMIDLQEAAGTALMPTVLRLTKGLTGYLQTLQEGGRRHAGFVRTLHEVGGALRTTWSIVQLLARGLRGAARVMGGWGDAFKLVLGLVLVNRFLKLKAAIAGSRLGLLLLGRQATATAATVEASEAGMATGAAGVTTKVALLRGALLALGRLGLITIAIELLIHRKFVGSVLGWIAGGDQPGGPTGIPTAGGQSAVDWARYLKGKGFTKAAARRRMEQTGLWYGDEQEITDALNQVYGRGKGGRRSGGGEPVVTGHRGKGPGDRAAFVAVQAARDPAARTVGFHLPGERKPYDCSAFVQAVYAKAGVHIGSTTYSQQHDGQPVTLANIIPGDIVLWDVPGDRQPPPNHVGIYVGGGICIHDHGASGGVDQLPVNYYKIVTIRRVGAAHGSIAGRRRTGGGPTGATADGGPLHVGHTSTHRAPHFVSRQQRLRESLAILAYERQVHQAENRGYLTGGQERRDVARLERLRKLLRNAHLTPTEMTRIQAQVRALWKKINDEISAGVKRARARAAALAKAHQEAIQKAERIAEQARNRFETIWGRMADKALQAFDRITQAGEDAISKRYDAPTPAEAALNALRQLQTQEDLAAGVTDAQSKLALAQRLGDPQMIAEAERELRDAQLAVQEDALQKQADAERAAADAARDREIQEYDDLRDIQRQGLSDMLDDLQTQLENGTISWSEAQAKLQQILGDSIGPMADLGALIGNAFTQSLLESVTGVGGAADAIAAALEEVRKLGFRWNPDTGEWEKIPPGGAQQGGDWGGGAWGHHPPGDDQPMAEGGFGVTRGPRRFLVGERGPEAYAFVPLRRAMAMARRYQRPGFGGRAGALGGGDLVEIHHQPILNLFVNVDRAIGSDLKQAGKELALPVRAELLRWQRSGGQVGFQAKRRSFSSTTPMADRGLR